MTSLAMQKTHFLESEWVRLRRFLIHGRTQTVRDHAAQMMKKIEQELAARQITQRREKALSELARLGQELQPEFYMTRPKV